MEQFLAFYRSRTFSALLPALRQAHHLPHYFNINRNITLTTTFRYSDLNFLRI